MAALLAALVAYDNYLLNTLLITSNDLRVAQRGQGLQGIDDYADLSDDDIGDMCTNIRKPGGTIPNPAYNPVNPVAGVPMLIPNPGVPVGHLIERRLKMLRYYCYHLQRVQRQFDMNAASLLTLSECYKLQAQHEQEEETKVELPAKLSNIDMIRQVLENIDDYLTRVRE
jgi:hypothetical protein